MMLLSSGFSGGLSRFYGPLFVVIGLLPSAGASAQPAPVNSDPLMLPAQVSSLAEQSLLLDIVDTGSRLVAVGERGHILYSDDRGQRWQQASVPASVTLTALYFPSPRFGWAVGHDGLILHSADAGLSWHKQLDGFSLNTLVVDYRREQVEALEAAVDSAAEPALGELEERLDNARFALEDAEAARDEGPTKPLLDLWFADDRHGWVVGAYGLLLETRDGGRRWQPRMAALDNPDGFHINAIGGDEQALYLAGEAGLLQRSQDGGASFEWLESPYEGSLFGLARVDTRLVLLGMRGRAFISGDQGESWDSLATGSSSSLSGAVGLADGRLLVVGQRGTVLVGEPQAEQLSGYTDPQRRGYSAVVQADSEHVLIVGQGGLQRLPLADLQETDR